MHTFTALVMAALVALSAFGGVQPAGTLTTKDLAGAWAGTASHGGETSPVGLELEPAKEGTLGVRLTIPAIHWYNRFVGTMPVQLSGNDVKLGPFTFRYDRESDSLTGTLPRVLVPVYDLSVTLRRTARLEFPPRPELDAPAAVPVWTFDGGAPFWGGTELADGVVYGGTDDGRLLAIDARSGRARWTFRAAGAIRTRLAVAGDLFVHADDGFLYKVAATTGAEQWRVKLEASPVVRLPPGDPKSRFDRYGSGAAVAGERVYVGTHDGRLVALDRTTGKPVWEFKSGDSVLAAPLVHQGRAYFGSYDGFIYALDAGNGQLVWKLDTGAPVTSTPAVHAGRLVVGSRSYDLMGVRLDTGAVEWKRYFWFSWVESSATIRDGIAYVGSSDASRLFAIDARSGRLRWATDVHGWSWGQPAVTADRVYAGTTGEGGRSEQRGMVVALDRKSGRPVWHYAAPRPEKGQYGFGTSPAIGAGLVFIGGVDGRMYAFRQ